MGDRAGLAGARAGENADRPTDRANRFLLLGIQPGQDVGHPSILASRTDGKVDGRLRVRTKHSTWTEERIDGGLTRGDHVHHSVVRLLQAAEEAAGTRG